MTNKPMLSVELRQALADFIEYSVPGPRSDDAMWYADKQALRALLDKPVCHNCAGLERNIPCPECKPAAQNQGEPLAWVECSPAWLKAGGDCTTAPRICVGREGISHLHPAHSSAEQPAPVAVAMPNVDELAQIIRKVDGSHTLGAGSLAEAILGEVAKLNGVKP